MMFINMGIVGTHAAQWTHLPNEELWYKKRLSECIRNGILNNVKNIRMYLYKSGLSSLRPVGWARDECLKCRQLAALWGEEEGSLCWQKVVDSRYTSIVQLHLEIGWPVLLTNLKTGHHRTRKDLEKNTKKDLGPGKTVWWWEIVTLSQETEERLQ